jgi:hypothetical protein
MRCLTCQLPIQAHHNLEIKLDDALARDTNLLLGASEREILIG